MRILDPTRRDPEEVVVTTDPRQIREWKTNLPKGHVREVSSGVRILPQAAGVRGDEADVEREPVRRRAYVEPSEVMGNTMDAIMRELRALEARDREAFMDRVRYYKQKGGWGHLTDEQAAEQVHSLVEKWVRAIAERGYHKHNRHRGANLDLVPGPLKRGAVLLPGQQGRSA